MYVREIGRTRDRASCRYLPLAADSVLNARLICALRGNLVSENHYLLGDNITFSERAEIALVSWLLDYPCVDS